MKKLIALICAALMLCTMTASALANGSIVELVAQPVANEPTYNEEVTLTPSGWGVKIDSLAQPEDNWLPEVKEIVDAVNNAAKEVTLKDLIVSLMGLTVNADKRLDGDKLTLKDANGKEIELDLSKGDFVSPLSNIAMRNGPESFYNMSVTRTVVYEQAKGRTADEFTVFIVNPVTGEFTFSSLNDKNFKSETGEVTITFPFMGSFALIEL